MSEELLTTIHEELMEQGKTLSSLNTKVESLVGNGQPGRIDKIETDVKDLQASKNQALGVASGFGFLAGLWEIIKWKYHL